MDERAWVLLSIGTCLSLLVATTPAPADESVFSYVTGMPAVEGVLEETRESSNSTSGLTLRKQVFRLEHDAYALRTHVLDASCAALAYVAEPHMVALQYIPKAPKSFSVAAMPDLYMEVYVRDEDRRIRVYEQVGGAAMADLTRRFQPTCRAL